tara:strand:- start:389 stop:2095 length:1707 start_codon:yes stop_codon:yes gene_type:complete
MAEKIVSPGVFTNEIDASFLPSAIGEIGAAIVGPTVRGPALVPTVVDSYSDYVRIFGESFTSGSVTRQYYTSYAAKEYLKHGSRLTVCRILPTDSGHASASLYHSSSVDALSFTLETLGVGADFNNDPGHGSSTEYDTVGGFRDYNFKVECTATSSVDDSFNILIRRGDDTNTKKIILETWNNLSLQPTASNYISKVIGDQKIALDGSGEFLTYTGQYPNKSKFVRVKAGTVNSGSTMNPKVTASAYFAGGTNGTGWMKDGGTPVFGSEINNTQTQGLIFSSVKSPYKDAITLLGNADEYDINLLFTPGLIYGAGANHNEIINHAINKIEDRADAFYVFDACQLTDTVATSAASVSTFDTSYAGTYYPWVEIADSATGQLVMVPPSVGMTGVYAFNDKVGHPWNAPAGLNRGKIDGAMSAFRKLSLDNRDELYEKKVNPIASFPGHGVVAWGQKTLQKKSSALDRINVRRLLIRVKKFIASSSKFLVFEQNNAALRRRFLNIVTPFLEQVQSNAGLTSFRVVMDESNNPPDLVDRNILYGQVFLQPAKTAEFIVLDFSVQPTGASFPE